MITHGVEVEDFTSLGQLRKEADDAVEAYKQQLTESITQEKEIRKEHSQVLNNVAITGSEIRRKLNQVTADINEQTPDFVQGNIEVEHTSDLLGSRLKYEALMALWEQGRGKVISAMETKLQAIQSDMEAINQNIRMAALTSQYAVDLLELMGWVKEHPPVNDTFKKLPEPTELKSIAAQVYKTDIYDNTIIYLQMCVHMNPMYYQTGVGARASSIRLAGDMDYWPHIDELMD